MSDGIQSDLYQGDASAVQAFEAVLRLVRNIDARFTAWGGTAGDTVTIPTPLVLEELRHWAGLLEEERHVRLARAAQAMSFLALVEQNALEVAHLLLRDLGRQGQALTTASPLFGRFLRRVDRYRLEEALEQLGSALLREQGGPDDKRF